MKRIFLFSFLIAILFLFYLFPISDNLGHWGGDSARYILLAQAIAEGKGYRIIYEPGEPKALYYHFMLPLILAPFIKIWGINFIILRSVIAFIASLSVILIYLLLKNDDKDIALRTSLIFSVSTMWLLYAGLILTEVPYTFFSLLSLIFFAKYLKSKSNFNISGILTSLFLIFALFTRFIAITILFGFFLFLFLERKKYKFSKIYLPLITMLLVYILWEIRTYLSESKLFYHFYSLYWKDPYNISLGQAGLFDFAKRWFINIWYYFNYIFSPLFVSLERLRFINIVLLLPLLYILFYRIKRGSFKFYDFYYLSYFILIPFWYWRNVRFFLPFSFFTLFYFFLGLKYLLQKLPANTGRYLVSLLFFFFMTINVWDSINYGIILRYRAYQLPKSLQDFLKLNHWIRDNIAEKTALIISRKPTLTALYTGNPSLVYPYHEEIWLVKKFIFEQRAKYIILDNFSKESINYLHPVIHYYNDDFSLLKTEGSCSLYKVNYEKAK